MEIAIRALFIFGFLQTLWAGVWFLIVAFRQGVVHGLLMLFFGGMYSIIFSILHWEEAKKPFFTGLIGGALIVGASLLHLGLADRQAFPGDPADLNAPAPASSFKDRITQAAAAGLAAKRKSGSSRNPQASSSGSEAKPAWTPKELVSQVLASASNAAGGQAGPASANEWNEARARLRVGGVMQTGNQLFATVNQSVVKVNEEVAVELNGRRYRFKVRQIDLRLNTVQFDPIEP